MNWITFLEYFFPHLPQSTYDPIAERIGKKYKFEIVGFADRQTTGCVKIVATQTKKDVCFLKSDITIDRGAIDILTEQHPYYLVFNATYDKFQVEFFISKLMDIVSSEFNQFYFSRLNADFKI